MTLTPPRLARRFDFRSKIYFAWIISDNEGAILKMETGMDRPEAAPFQ